MLRPLVIVALMVAGGRPAPPAAPSPDLGGLRLIHLDLALSVDYEEARLAGTATLTMENTSEEPVSLIPLLLYRLMMVSEVTDEAGGALAFTQDIVTMVDWPQYQANHITVILDAPLAPGQRTGVRVGYGGYLAGLTETGMRYVKDRIEREFTIIREDALAFPVLGVPSWEQNRAVARAPFSFRARITVPEDLTVAAGGRMAQRTLAHGQTTFEYRNIEPVAFLNIAIAPYQVLEGQDATVFYFPADSVGAGRVLDRLEAALALLGRWFGPIGLHAGITVIEIPEGFGSQASLAAGIIQTREAFNDSTQYRQLYHELSHLWNAPDLDVPSPRWNEGLASFLERRMAAELDGWPDMAAFMEDAARATVTRFDGNPSYQATPLIDYGKASLTDLSYRVGMLAFYALDRLIGPEAFNAAIGSYLRLYRDTGGTTADLSMVFQRAAPTADMTGFFEDWFYSMTWYERLRSGASLSEVIEGNRK